MKIAIQAADLDCSRIDGTRVYIKNMLRFFGRLDKSSHFLIYHKKNFNSQLAPPNFSNYKIISQNSPFFWTQTRFCFSLLKEKPDVLWMPMHNVPYFVTGKIKTFVTIHDLAFKYFPEMFSFSELGKLNFLTSMAIGKSYKIITISQSSKKDILKFYPQVKADKIKVISHGFDEGVFGEEKNPKEEENIKRKFKIEGKYILYLGALQPRKNLEILIEAFEKIKNWEAIFRRSENSKNDFGKDLKLVLAGEKAWLWKNIFEKIKKSHYAKDIITPGKINFSDVGNLMRGAEVFCFPSLYEGFGLPILEAMSAGVPVVTSFNSSLPEVAGEAALYFNGYNAEELKEKLESVLKDSVLRKELVEKGKKQVEKFSWEKCAQETLNFLKEG